jgi:prepilin-type N-terminal cleavage/methylation domain-containing protein
MMMNKNGFTLIEMMLAMLLLCVGIMAMASMQIRSIIGNGTAQATTESNYSLSGAAESFMALPFNDEMLLVGDHPITDGSGQADIEKAFSENGRYTLSWAVTDIYDPTGRITGVIMKKINIRCEWIDNGKSRFSFINITKPRV